MKATIGDLLDLVDVVAPFELSEKWDNSGLQIGDTSWITRGILVGLDVSMPLLEEAVRLGANLIVTHHPLMIQPVKNIDFSTMPGSVIKLCAADNLAVISAHTNLDKAQDGLNDLFADWIGLKNTLSLLPESALSFQGGAGLGRVGWLSSEETLGSLIKRVKKVFSLDKIRITGNLDQRVASVAVCTGSGGSLLSAVFNSGADVYITGDIKYHEARELEERGVGLIDVGHFVSEQIAIDLLVDRLTALCKDQGIDVKITGFSMEKDPFIIL